MNPIPFKESNFKYAAGQTTDGLEYQELHVHRHVVEEDLKMSVVVSKWRTTQEELINMLIDPEFYLIVSGLSQPPVSVVGFSPFETPEDIVEKISELSKLKGMLWAVIERVEQITEHNYMPDHDLQHRNNELVDAAICYLEQVHFQDKAENPENEGKFFAPGLLWPFEPEYFKPRPDPIKNLLKAIGFLIAEVDRRVNSAINEGETPKDSDQPEGDSNSGTPSE